MSDIQQSSSEIPKFEVDYSRLEYISPTAQHAETAKKEQAEYLAKLVGTFSKQEALPESPKKLITALSTLETKSEGERGSASKDIVKLAKTLILKMNLLVSTKPQMVAKSAAAIGKAKSALFRLQKEQVTLFDMKNESRALALELKDLKENQEYYKEKEKLVGLSDDEEKDFTQLKSKITTTQKKLDSLNKEIEKQETTIPKKIEMYKEKQKNLEALQQQEATLKTEKEALIQQHQDLTGVLQRTTHPKMTVKRKPPTTMAKFKPLGNISNLSQKVPEKKTELQESTDKKSAELQTLTTKIEDITKKLSEYTKNIQATQTEVNKLKTEIKPMIPLGLDSLNPVYLEEEPQAVFKSELAELDTRAQEVSSWFDMPDAVVASTAAQLQIPLETKEGGLKAKAQGMVQELIPRAVAGTVVYKDEKLGQAILKQLDLPDTQKKLVMQAFLASWDLHYGNAIFTPQVNTEYLKCEERSWEYQKADGTWEKTKDFTELVQLKLKGEIDENTKVKDSKNTNERTISSDSDVKKACSVPWQCLFFDNERTLGGQRAPSSGDHNDFQIYKKMHRLPVRSFFNGLPIGTQKLEPTVTKWLEKDIAEKKNEIEKHITEGHHDLWKFFSQDTQKLLKEWFASDTFYYSADILEGGDKTELVEQMPKNIMQALLKDLKKHKVIQSETEIPTKLLAEKLFPRIDPAEGKALLTRIDRAKGYIELCGDIGDTLKDFVGLCDKSKTAWSEETCKKLCKTLKEAKVGVKEQSTSHLEKEAICTRIDAAIKLLESQKSNSTLTEETLKQLTHITLDLTDLATPTLQGLNFAMYPMLAEFIDLAAAIELSYSSITSDSPSAIEAYIKESCVHTKWGKEQQDTLTGCLSACQKYLNPIKMKCYTEGKTEEAEKLSALLEKIAANMKQVEQLAKKQVSKEEHDAFISDILANMATIKQLVPDAKFYRSLPGAVMKAKVQQTRPSLEAIKEQRKNLFQEKQAFYDTHSDTTEIYDRWHCGKVLERAKEIGLFLGDKDNKQYIGLKKRLDGVKLRIGDLKVSI